LKAGAAAACVLPCPREQRTIATSSQISTGGLQMARKYVDCRLFPSDSKCSIAISADTEDEVVEAATQHAVHVHKHEDSPQLRQQIRSSVKDGSPTP
jgi:predicted small metal-binding protein